MIFQYCSDLHLEFPENKSFLKKTPLQTKGDILLLAGDVIPFTAIEKHADFFNYVSDHFKHTYWIPGNHEYYHCDAAKKSGVLNEKTRSNVSLVNNTTIVHENTKIIFSTLWSNISPAYEWDIERNVSDFQVIKYNGFRFSSVQFNEFHRHSIDFIKQEINKPHTGTTIVVTHHVPTLLNYPAQYKNSNINPAFAVELFDFIETSNIDYWIYGHHHINTPEFKIGNTTMLTNQVGYVQNNEHASFKTDAIIEMA